MVEYPKKFVPNFLFSYMVMARWMRGNLHSLCAIVQWFIIDQISIGIQYAYVMRNKYDNEICEIASQWTKKGGTGCSESSGTCAFQTFP
jgi:hypothetical protein